MANASLQANLSAALGQVPDPFAIARSQSQEQPAPEASVMQHPFGPMMMSGPVNGTPLTQEPTLQQVAQPIEQLKFPDLAKQHGIDVSGLAPSKELGGLQLMKRMQSAWGTGFSSHEAFKPMLAAWDSHAADGSKRDLEGMQSRAKRTLAALMGQR